MKNNNKPFMMKPGSKEIDTPGSFRADSKAMMFKNNIYNLFIIYSMV